MVIAWALSAILGLCYILTRAVRLLYGHCAGPFVALSILCHAALHYLPCGCHYLPWAGLGGHCGDCAGIICHSQACVVIARVVRSLRGSIRGIIHCAPCCTALSAVRQPLSVVCGSRQSLWPLRWHHLPFSGKCSHCGGS